MRIGRWFFGSWILCGVAGCVTPPPSTDFSSPPAVARSFSLSERLVVIQKAAPLATSAAEVSLAPGTYVAEAENAQGTLFRGPPGCVMDQIQHGYRVSSGGLWVPKAKDAKPRMYFIQYTDQVEYDTREAAIAGRGGRPAWGSAQGAESRLAVVPVDRGGMPSTGASVIGAGIGSGIVNAMLASEVRAARGKPAFLWEVDSPELRELILRLKTGS